MRPLAHIFASGAALALLLLGCAQQPGAPVVDRNARPDAPTTARVRPRVATSGEIYTIREDDTLYGIAWRHDLDYKALAAANGIAPPYTVYPGQRIRLREFASPASPTLSRERASSAPPRTTASAPPRPAPPRPAAPRTPAPTPASASGWRAPVSAKPVRRFGGASKGIDYELPPNTPVKAAAAGEVVYAGPGLGGYRHLLIVKASERHLVAYGVNVPPVPGEGARVVAGATIATIGSGDATAGRFHFEIRDNGKPVNPATLIGGL